MIDFENAVRARRNIAEMRQRSDPGVGDIVRIYGGIGSYGAIKGDATALAICAADKRKTLAVIVDSAGGTVKDAQRICDAIMDRKGLTRTIGVRSVSSAAAVIFAAGSERRAAHDTKFLLHFAARPIDQENIFHYTASELRAAAAECEKCDKWMLEFLHQRTRHPTLLLQKLLDEDKFMTAAEARLMGLVTHIQPKPPEPTLEQRARAVAEAARARRATATRTAGGEANNAAIAPRPVATSPRVVPPLPFHLLGRPIGIAPNALGQMIRDWPMTSAGRRMIWG